jgi:hypothetical protein
MEQILIKENKYNGRYIAIKDFGDSTVIADSKDPKEAYDKAIKQGYSNPVIVFIPAKDMVQIY